MFTTCYIQPGVLEVTGTSHCACCKLIVAGIGRTGGRGRPLGGMEVDARLLGRRSRARGKGNVNNMVGPEMGGATSARAPTRFQDSRMPDSWNPRIVESWSRRFSNQRAPPRESRIPKFHSSGLLEHWNLALLESWNLGVSESWNFLGNFSIPKFLYLKFPRFQESWNLGNAGIVPFLGNVSISRFLDFLIPGFLDFWNSGILESWSNAILESRNPGIFRVFEILGIPGIEEPWNPKIVVFSFLRGGILESWILGMQES